MNFFMAHKEDFIMAIRICDKSTVQEILSKNNKYAYKIIKAHDHKFLPLGYAAWEGTNLDIIELLLKTGVDINEQDVEGWTALHLACKANNDDMVIKLLELGADTTIEDNKGRTSFKFANQTAKMILSPKYKAKIEQEKKEEAIRYKTEKIKRESEKLRKQKERIEGKWLSETTAEIIHEHEIASGRYRITDIFNFNGRYWKSITKDLEEGGATQETKIFDELPDKRIIHTALEKLNQDFGGNIDPDIIENRVIIKKKRPNL